MKSTGTCLEVLCDFYVRWSREALSDTTRRAVKEDAGSNSTGTSYSIRIRKQTTQALRLKDLKI